MAGVSPPPLTTFFWYQRGAGRSRSIRRQTVSLLTSLEIQVPDPVLRPFLQASEPPGIVPGRAPESQVTQSLLLLLVNNTPQVM